MGLLNITTASEVTLLRTSGTQDKIVPFYIIAFTVTASLLITDALLLLAVTGSLIFAAAFNGFRSAELNAEL